MHVNVYRLVLGMEEKHMEKWIDGLIFELWIPLVTLVRVPEA